MDQKLIGSFLKELRNEKGMTQEELAEKFYVSRRTVARWEAGSNLPDLSILVELAGFYDVELREILDGKRTEMKMNKELEQTVLKAAEYSNEDKQKMMKVFHLLYLAGFIFALVSLVLEFADSITGPFADFMRGFGQGMSLGLVGIGLIMTSNYGNRLRAVKMRILGKKNQTEG